MILEFAGPPGSGKSTLESLLITALKKEGYRVLDRHELRVEEGLKDRGSGGSYNPFLKKMITLKGLLSLMTKTLYRHPDLLTDLLKKRNMHRIKSTARVYEDQSVIKRYCSGTTAPEFLNLSEGLFHHIVAMNVWGSFDHKHDEIRIPNQTVSFLTSIQEPVLIKTQVDFHTLEKRLKDRGVSSNWPGAINLSYVLERFLYYEQLLTDNSFSDRFKVFTINANGDESTLIDQVESLVSDLVSLRGEDIIGSA